jgi:hypothetical protein
MMAATWLSMLTSVEDEQCTQIAWAAALMQFAWLPNKSMVLTFFFFPPFVHTGSI